MKTSTADDERRQRGTARSKINGEGRKPRPATNKCVAVPACQDCRRLPLRLVFINTTTCHFLTAVLVRDNSALQRSQSVHREAALGLFSSRFPAPIHPDYVTDVKNERPLETLQHTVEAICTASGGMSTFPFLTAEGFDRACQAFLNRVDAAGGARELGWLGVEYMTSEPAHPILRISKYTNPAGDLPAVDASETREVTESREQSQEDLIEDDDHETLVRHSNKEQKSAVDYDITFSTSYHVPVMYFLLRATCQVGPAALDDIYNRLVPHQHHQSLRSSGIMGGISFGYHPQSGIPAYFVHPCNTATAMKAIVGDGAIEPENYLLAWLGLIGSCINLNLPGRLFMGSPSRAT